MKNRKSLKIHKSDQETVWNQKRGLSEVYPKKIFFGAWPTFTCPNLAFRPKNGRNRPLSNIDGGGSIIILGSKIRFSNRSLQSNRISQHATYIGIYHPYGRYFRSAISGILTIISDFCLNQVEINL